MDQPKRKKQLPARLREPEQTVIENKVNKIEKNKRNDENQLEHDEKEVDLPKEPEIFKENIHIDASPQISNKLKNIPARLCEPEQVSKETEVDSFKEKEVDFFKETEVDSSKETEIDLSKEKEVDILPHRMFQCSNCKKGLS